MYDTMHFFIAIATLCAITIVLLLVFSSSRHKFSGSSAIWEGSFRTTILVGKSNVFEGFRGTFDIKTAPLSFFHWLATHL